MADLREIMQMLNNVEIRTKKLETDTPKIQKSMNSFKQVERLALRYLTLSRRMGLPDNISKQIDTIATLIVMIRMAQMSMGLMTGNPISVMIGFAGLIGIGLTAKDMMQMG